MIISYMLHPIHDICSVSNIVHLPLLLFSSSDSKVWTEGECTDAPNSAINPNDRPHYETELECCEASYAGQKSGVCKKDLPDQPTSAPTTEEYDMWYPDYDTAWSVAGCSNARPLPFTTGGRPVYSSQLECCKASYGGQQSNACINGLPNPPTGSPTESGGLDVYYPDYSSGSWATGTCINTRKFHISCVHIMCSYHVFNHMLIYSYLYLIFFYIQVLYHQTLSRMIVNWSAVRVHLLDKVPILASAHCPSHPQVHPPSRED